MLTKETVVSSIEVLELGQIQVRTTQRIIEDGVVIAEQHHRHVVVPGDDFSGEDSRVQAIAAVEHTPERVQAYQDMLAASEAARA